MMYSPATINSLSGGLVKPQDLRNWRFAGLFNTPVPEGSPGKAVQMPMLAVFEAILLAHLGKAVGLHRAKEINGLVLDRLHVCEWMILDPCRPDKIFLVCACEIPSAVATSIGLIIVNVRGIVRMLDRCDRALAA